MAHLIVTDFGAIKSANIERIREIQADFGGIK